MSWCRRRGCERQRIKGDAKDFDLSNLFLCPKWLWLFYNMKSVQKLWISRDAGSEQPGFGSGVATDLLCELEHLSYLLCPFLHLRSGGSSATREGIHVKSLDLCLEGPCKCQLLPC